MSEEWEVFYPACFVGDNALCILLYERDPDTFGGISEARQHAMFQALVASHYLFAHEGVLYFFEPLVGGFTTYSPSGPQELSLAQEKAILRTLEDAPMLLAFSPNGGGVRTVECLPAHLEDINFYLEYYRRLEECATAHEVRAFMSGGTGGY
jgi:hypothetical protein